MTPDPTDLERALLGGERRYTRREVAQLAGVDVERANDLWRALGFADVVDDVKAFTDRDVWALKTVDELGKEGWLDEATQISMTRALGQSMSRLADWQLSTMGSLVDPERPIEEGIARAQHLLPIVEQLMGYVWRRHLSATAGRVLAAGSDEFAQTLLTVGFTDLVGYTSLTRHIDEAELATLIERFDNLASDTVAELGGRIVKTIGDEVLYVADDQAAGAEIGLVLTERIAADTDLPDTRTGLATGTVLSRLGDVYGAPVNIAARLTSVARPGSVLVDRDLAVALEGRSEFRVRRLPPRPVRGYAMLQPYRLRRGEAEGAD